MDCDCLIEELKKKTFGERDFSDKIAIVHKGRPQPQLLELSGTYKDKTRQYTRYFNTTNYVKTPWLAGCSKMNKVFCWPCLLFNPEKSVWSESGFSDLNNLCKAIGKHEKTRNHITCFVKLQVFGDAHDGIDLQLDHQNSLEIVRHNEQVQKNRYILSCLINAVSFLAKQELPFRGHRESMESVNRGNYIELLNYTAQYDHQLEDHLKTSTVFQGTSPQIQNDLIVAISGVLIDAIKQEIEKSLFVSILLDETSDIANKSQLSTCFRYVDSNGNVQERFISSSYVRAEALFHHVEKIVAEYGVENKIVGQTYDGAPVMSGSIGGLQSLVRGKYPEALFVHCYSHELNIVLQQSVSNIKECSSFFVTLSGIACFFSNSPKRTQALKQMVDKKLPRLAPMKWNFSSHLANTVRENRDQLVEFFESIVENAEEWDSETVLQARGCASFLTGFQCCFLLEVFSLIFSHSDVLYDVLQSKSMDIMYCCQRIEDAKGVFKDMRLNGFEKIFNKVKEKTEEQPRKRRNQDPEVVHRTLFIEIMDNLYTQLTDRFGNYNKLHFASLLDSQSFPQLREKFPESALASLRETYSRHFDFIQLRNELIVLYSSCDPEICNQPVHVLVKYMCKKQLMLAMPETYKLGVLILTIPSTTVTVEHSFSTLKRIKCFTRSTQGQESIETGRFSGLALISVEKELLQQLKNNPKFKFLDAVTENFCSQTRRMEFMFK